MAYGAFGDIRALLHDAPSRGAWEKLCAEVRLWREPELSQVVFPYVLSQLERWPDPLRVIRPDWAKDLLRGRARGSHFTALARSIHIERFTPDHDQWMTLAELDWRSLRHMHLDRVVLPAQRHDNPLITLSAHGWFRQLDSLTLSIFDTPSLCRALAQGTLSHLSSLSLHLMYFHEDDLLELALAPWPKLTTLSFANSNFQRSRRSHTPGPISPLHEDVFAPNLEAFEIAHANHGRGALHDLRVAPWLPSLKKLSVNTTPLAMSSTRLFDSGVLRLLKEADLSALVHLHLNGDVDYRHLGALEHNPTTGNLKRLEATGVRHFGDVHDLANRIVASGSFSDELKSHWRGFVGLD